MVRLTQNSFIRCGVTGWCIEIIFTSICNRFQDHDRAFHGNTSIWMFPIYGCAALIKPLAKHLQKYPTVLRGVIYMTGFFFTEYTSGWILKKFHCCPWNYGNAIANVQGLIRLDFAPLWFLCGLGYERLLTNSDIHHKS